MFRGDLTSHVHFYTNLCEVANNENVSLRAITFLNIKNFFIQYKLVNHFRKNHNIQIYPSLFPYISEVLFFGLQLFFYSKIVVHTKKTNPRPLLLLKKFSKKIKLIIDLEGDLIFEKDFLQLNPYKDEFYKNDIISITKNLVSHNRLLDRVDKIIVLNDSFKAILVKRNRKLEDKIITSNILSFRRNIFCYDDNLRNKYRSLLNCNEEPIICYIGNVYYSWQNISKTIKLFKKIKELINVNAKLLLLVRSVDHHIVREFIKKEKIKSEDHILKNVDNTEVLGYLNAADLGIVIRDFHPMNSIVTSGKLLDYLGSGLPVITTSILDKIPNEIKNHGFGYVMDDIKLENININEVKSLLNFDLNKRKAISNWANLNFSLEVSAKNYIRYLKKLKH
ncbi:hypothetical protein N9605_01840 [Flavobacteriaceae bacterium]|nr:hypothetical protein [Flavobacteriaceae bacterium]